MTQSFRGDPSDVIKAMRVGIPVIVVTELAVRFGMGHEALCEALRLPYRTIKSRIAKNRSLSSTEQDRMFRADRVWTRAVDVLEDEANVRNWMSQRNRSLCGEAPLSLLDTVVGYELVIDTLGRIEHGVIS